MNNGDSGEPSRKKSSDIYDNDRPLKKARYLWQVKGKYHLKDNTVKMLSTDRIEDNDSPSKSPDCAVKKSENNNNNIAQVRNNNLCSDRSCIEVLIANSDKIMDFPDPESPPKNIDKSISDEIPITLVKPNLKSEDYYLRKWQARQIAKGFVDNTINRVLESWMVAPFDAADFVENCDNGGQVEDEGILMAIQSHGLHSGIRENRENGQKISGNACMDGNSDAFSSKTTKSPKNWNDIDSCTCSSTRKENQINSFPPFHRRMEDDNSLDYDNPLSNSSDQVQASFTKSSPKTEKPISKQNSSQNSLFSEDSKENNPTFNTTNDLQSYDSLKMDDTDFLDAAVAVAIQKKGLSSLNCVDC